MTLQGLGGPLFTVLLGFPGSAYAWGLCLCVCLLNFCLSVYQFVCLSKSLYMPVCLHVSLSPPLSLFSHSLSLSLSIYGEDLADQGSELDTGQFKSLFGTLNQSRSRLTFIILIMYHLPITTTTYADPESSVREGPTLTTFFSLMGEELSKYHY